MQNPSPYLKHRRSLLLTAACLSAVASPSHLWAVAWNGTDPGSSAISTTGLTDNYGQFVDESVVTNTAQGEYGTGTYLGNGWVLTALHVVSTATYGVLEPGSAIHVNIFGTNYSVANYQTFGSSDIVLCQIAGFTSGTATTLPGVERSQIYTGSSENGHLEQLGGFGNHDVLNSGTAVNNQAFYRGFNVANASGGFINVSATGNSKLVQDGYVLGYQQAGDSGSGLWMENGPDQDLDLRDWSLIGALDTGTTPGSFGDGGQYARVSSYAGTIINTVFPHAWLTWTANAASTAAVDGSGTWNLSSTNFTDGANFAFNGPEKTQIVTFGNGNGAAGTVTLGATIPFDAITFNAAGSGSYTIAGAGALALTAGADSIITTNVDATISANIFATNTSLHGYGSYPANNKLEKNGAANLTLTGNVSLSNGVAFYARGGGTTITNNAVFTAGFYTSIAVYSGESASLTLSGNAAYNSANQDFNLADLGGTGTLNVQNSATLNVANLYVGKGSAGLTGAGGTGTVNQSGGSITTTSLSLATNHPQSIGTFNLNAGTLSTASITGGLGNSTFNFNGGTLNVSANTATLMQNLTSATINNTALINTSIFNATLNQPLAHNPLAPTIDGGLTKSGSGTLTLGAASSYTGPTTITAGKILLNPASGAAAVAIQPVAAYSFDSVSGSAVLNTGSGGTAMNGALTGSAAITAGGKFGNALNLTSGGSLVVNNPITDTGGAANWTISAWVKPTTPGASILNKSDGSTWTWDNSIFYLGDGSGAGSGGIPSAVRYGRGFFQASASTPSVANGAWHMVTYVDAAGTYAIYTDGVLDALSATNAGFQQAVQQGNVVTFGTTVDNVASDGTVNFNGMLDEIQIYNRALNTSQVQRLFNTNSPNPGPATAILPTASNLSIASGASLDLNGVSQQIGSLTGPAGSSISLGAGQLTVNSPASSAFAGLISGAGTLAKQGAGSLTLSAANTFTGGTSLSAGTLIVAHPQALGTGPLAIHTTAILQLQSGLSAAVKIPALTFDGTTNNWTGSLDLTNNKLIIQDPFTHAVSLANLENQSHSVITSSTMPANFAIAVLDNAVTNFSTFGNIPVDTNSILLSPELLGDANADGSIDLTDLSTLLNNFGAATLAWTSGNFDGAPIIDLTDLSDTLNNFGASNAFATNFQLPITNDQLPTTPAPEPSTLFPLLLSGATLYRRPQKKLTV